MIYTQKQLKQAYCDKHGIQLPELEQIRTSIQTRIEAQRASLERELQELPTTAKEEMKREAIEFLVEQSKEQVFVDNADLTL